MNPITEEIRTGIVPGSYKKHLFLIALLAFSLGTILSLGACSSDKEENVGGTSTVKPGTRSESLPIPAAEKIVPVSATASSSTATDTPNLSFDGDMKTVWNSGAVAPSWILLDLGKPMTISRVRLNVAQTPSGPATHHISGGPTPDNLTLIGTLDVNATDGEWIELSKPASNVRYLKIETIKSPSWIAWREIEIAK